MSLTPHNTRSQPDSVECKREVCLLLILGRLAAGDMMHARKSPPTMPLKHYAPRLLFETTTQCLATQASPSTIPTPQAHLDFQGETICSEAPSKASSIIRT
eukprot:2348473-Amphidinium_carterae.1